VGAHHRAAARALRPSRCRLGKRELDCLDRIDRDATQGAFWAFRGKDFDVAVKMQKGQTATLWHPASNNRLDHSSGGGARPLASYPAAAESPRR